MTILNLVKYKKMKLDSNTENSIVGAWLAWITGLAVEIMPLLQAISFIAATVLSIMGIIKMWKGRNK